RQRGVRQRVQGPVGGVPAPRGRGRAVPVGSVGGRQGRPARRARPALGGGGAAAGGAGPVSTLTTLRLPTEDGRLVDYSLAAEPAASYDPPAAPPRSRAAFAAAHVVADPLAANGPGTPAALDWEATLAFRRHLWGLGLGVADAMDTAQR